MLSIKLFPETEDMPISTLRAVEDLFKSEYYSYHYLDQLGDKQRYRLVAKYADEIAGYATLTQVGKFAYFSNLLVKSKFRGQGVGNAIDAARASLSLELKLCPYASCVTVGVQSQLLKRSNRMYPLNFRAGYRRGVFFADEISSAVSFIGKPNFPLLPIDDESVSEDIVNERIRYVTNSTETVVEIIKKNQHNDCYVDVLCAPSISLDILQFDSLAPAGLDVDMRMGKWGRLFQIRNQRYTKGMEGCLDLAVNFSEIIEARKKARELFCGEIA